MDTIKTRWQSGLKVSTFNGIYQGLNISIICTIPALSLYLAVYENMKYHSDYPLLIQNNRVLKHALSAGCAELLSGIVWTPMEVLKQHLQVNSSASLLERFRFLSQEYGLMSMYRGYWMTIVSFLPYSMIYFSLFEELQHMKQSKKSTSNSFIEILKNAAIASSIASILTSPLDLLKTRWQLQPKHSSLRILSWIHNQVTTQISIRDWITSAIGRTLWVTPNGAISLSIYEYLKSFNE